MLRTFYDMARLRKVKPGIWNTWCNPFSYKLSIHVCCSINQVQRSWTSLHNCQNSKQPSAINYFRKELHHMFNMILNAPRKRLSQMLLDHFFRSWWSDMKMFRPIFIYYLQIGSARFHLKQCLKSWQWNRLFRKVQIGISPELPAVRGKISLSLN